MPLLVFLIVIQEDRFDATFGSQQESFNFNGGPPEVDERLVY